MAVTGTSISGVWAARRAVAGGLRPILSLPEKQDGKGARRALERGRNVPKLRDEKTGRFIKATPVPDWVTEFERAESQPVRIRIVEKPISWVYWYVWILSTVCAVAYAYAVGQMSVLP